MSPGFDLALVLVPAVAAVVALLFFREVEAPLPLGMFFVLVVAFDVAHVWATLYVSYLDPEARARRRTLLWLTPLAVFLLGWRLHVHSAVAFWTVLAYVAIHHFAAQQWGFVALYRTLAGEREPLDRYLDRWTLWTGALGPVVLWHTSAGAFDWFGHGEVFALRLDPAIRPDVVAFMALLGAVWLARQAWHLARGRFNPGKTTWMVATWLSWSVGLVWAEHPVVALACINLLHGLPFLALVHARAGRRWRDAPITGAPAVATIARALPLFLGLVVLLATAEEWLWEGLVWHRYVGPLVSPLDGATLSAVVALLATPQVVHYYLDAWLWKLDGTNPDFEALVRGR